MVPVTPVRPPGRALPFFIILPILLCAALFPRQGQAFIAASMPLILAETAAPERALSGDLAPGQRDLVMLPAIAGQKLSLRLSDGTEMRLYAPGTGSSAGAHDRSGAATSVRALAALDRYAPAAQELQVVVPASGSYPLLIGGSPGPYRLWLAADSTPPLLGEVRTLTPGRRLNMRAAPSLSSPVIGQWMDGAQLRILGCRMNEARRWCQVVGLTSGAMGGWVAGDYLIMAGSGALVAPRPLPLEVTR